MNRSNKIIISLLMICALIIIMIILVILSSEKEENATYGVIDMAEDTIDTAYEEIYFYEYKIIKTCLQSYIDKLNINNSSYVKKDERGNYVKIDENTKKNYVYNLLSENYILSNDITISNIYEYVNPITEQKMIIPIEIVDKTSRTDTAKVKNYGVKSIVISTYNKEDYYYLYTVINIDNDNSTFSIEPLNSEEDLENFKINYEMQRIISNNVNTYYNISFKIEDTVKDYMLNYKNIMLSDIELAYEYLDKEYKQKRFPTLNNYKEYIQDNKRRIETIRADKYEVNYLPDYTEYICQDQYGNYYIFKENEIMNYAVILDTYTLELPQFFEKYNSANSLQKVGYNINKVIEAINNKDYAYVYSKLSEGFKDTKYSTIDSFSKDIKNNLFELNEVRFNSATNEGDTYIYKISISDIENKQNIREMTIIMKLKANTDFVMSFSFET